MSFLSYTFAIVGMLGFFMLLLMIAIMGGC